MFIRINVSTLRASRKRCEHRRAGWDTPEADIHPLGSPPSIINSRCNQHTASATIPATSSARRYQHARRRPPARRNPLRLTALIDAAPLPRRSVLERPSNRIANSSPKPTRRGTTTARSRKHSVGQASKPRPRRSGAMCNASRTAPPARMIKRSRTAHRAKLPLGRPQLRADEQLE